MIIIMLRLNFLGTLLMLDYIYSYNSISPNFEKYLLIVYTSYVCNSEVCSRVYTLEVLVTFELYCMYFKNMQVSYSQAVKFMFSIIHSTYNNYIQ